MPRKSKKSKVSDNTALTAEELYKLRAFVAEADLAQVKLTIVMAQKKELIRQIDPENKIGVMDEKMRLLAAEAGTKRTHYNETLSQIGVRMGVDINKCTWDDETGLVTIVDD